MEIVKATTEQQIKAIVSLAEEIWRETYTPLLPEGQVDYMLEKFQSEKAVKEQMKNGGYEYYVLVDENGISGFTGIVKEEGRLFLSKLYVHSSARRKGYATKVFEFLKGVAKENGCAYIYLTVNKDNSNAVKTYEKSGFKNVKSAVTDIGNGYVMDDYIMQLDV